ncbi:hypothetical protein [Nocardia sp. NPDC058114]|uniref:hypothetical protein n=1 Tax=Nocardia sp. NPDC058114 TaxID=3346346 RepID=UPI0036D8D0E9
MGRLGALVAAVAMAAACSTGPASGPVRGAIAEDSVFYYYTSDELILVRGQTTLAQISQPYDFGNPEQTSVVWTNSGDYLVSFVIEPIQGSTKTAKYLNFTSTRDGAQGRVPCECEGLVPVGANGVVVLSVPWRNAYLYTPDAKRGEEVRVPARDPNLVNGGQWQVIGQMRSKYLLGQIASVSRDRQQDHRLQLQTIGTDGSDSQVIATGIDSGHTPVMAVPENPADGVSGIAIVQATHGHGCAKDSPVIVVAADGKVATTDMTNAYPPGYEYAVQGGLLLRDLTWSPFDSTFHAEVTAWQCEPIPNSIQQRAINTTSTRWVLDNGSWVVDTWPTSKVVRQLDALGTMLTIDKPRCVSSGDPEYDNHPERRTPEYCVVGELYVSTADTRKLLSEKAIAVSVAPRSPVRPA